MRAFAEDLRVITHLAWALLVVLAVLFFFTPILVFAGVALFAVLGVMGAAVAPLLKPPA
ncbi:hypothetical protein [Caulobacter vibrioides]|uniref:hypothetical protein n=1 Tax=Caulobacter vibrioides TaxID=155892 RepID=UPI0013DDDA84|nr:hypothetical protein [Caulobacter vibrioides]